MKSFPIYQVDAFTDRVFSGNPAAVVPLDDWLPDARLQAIAAENNLSETAFFVPRGGHCELRWFTPTVEVDLCGHATLAAASVILEEGKGGGAEDLKFSTRSGLLRVRASGQGELREYTLDFPADPPAQVDIPPYAETVMGVRPIEFWTGRRNLALVRDEAQLRAIRPRFGDLGWLAGRNLIVTAPSARSQYDFVSRYFAPNSGIDEDPVTGSAHCTLAPFWSQRLGKTEFSAFQASQRGGALRVVLTGDRVLMTGRCVRFLEGRIFVPA